MNTGCLRIAIYTETALPKMGGQENVVDALARQFQKLGHEVTVLAPRPRPPLRVDDRGFPYLVVRHPRFYSTRRMVAAYRWFLLRLFSERKFDLLHCHGLYPSGYLAALCKARMNVPIVLTSHGGDVYEKNFRLVNPRLRSRYELAVRSADRLIAISDFTRQGFLRMGAEEKRIINIPNGVDYEEYSNSVPRPAQLPADLTSGRYFFFIGRLAQRKGVDVLLRAIAQTDAAGPRLAIAGDGDERPALQRLAKELNIAQRVHFLGRTTGPAKLWLLQNCIATIMPSQSWEAFPLVVLESYAASRPVIASKIPGLIDLVKEGQTGMLVPEMDPTALAGAIKQMPPLADDLGRNARKWSETFAWPAIAARHIDVYKELLGN